MVFTALSLLDMKLISIAAAFLLLSLQAAGHNQVATSGRYFILGVFGIKAVPILIPSYRRQAEGY